MQVGLQDYWKSQGLIVPKTIFDTSNNNPIEPTRIQIPTNSVVLPLTNNPVLKTFTDTNVAQTNKILIAVPSPATTNLPGAAR